MLLATKSDPTKDPKFQPRGADVLAKVATPCARAAARPRRNPTAEQRDDLAPADHSMTSSARASRVGGTSRPSILAVSALMTSSNLAACTTGKSAGFAPLRIRPT